MRASRRQARSPGAEERVVSGIVSPAGWDEAGSVAAVCIVSDQGNPCFVLPGGANREVLSHLKRYVSATGLVETVRGVMYMQVDSVVPAVDPNGPSDVE